jgi:predicted NBD/HSP70 family sugar kinase
MHNMTVTANRDAGTVKLLDGSADVLEAVRRHGCTSRLEIMERTGLSRMVTAQRVQQLIEVGLLHEEGLGRSSGGRRPRRLMFDPPGHLLVADVGFTSIDAAITDLRGRLLAHVAEEADVKVGPEAILTRIEELFSQLLSDAGEIGRLRGVGVGIPAPVEFSTGRTVAPPFGYGWDGFPLRDRLAERFAAPAWVDNDVNIMMLGELQEGAARGHRDVVFVKCGTGTGLSLVSDGHLHRGALGSAGQLGNLLYLATKVADVDLPSPQDPSSFWLSESLIQRARELAVDGSSPWLAAAVERGESLSTRLLAEAAGRGDTASRDLLRRAGTVLGTTLATVVGLFNPSVVVVGGGMSEAGDFFLAAIREVIYGQAVPLATRELQVVKAELGSKAGVMGAAAMVIDQLFSNARLETTVAQWLAEE